MLTVFLFVFTSKKKLLRSVSEEFQTIYTGQYLSTRYKIIKQNNSTSSCVQLPDYSCMRFLISFFYVCHFRPVQMYFVFFELCNKKMLFSFKKILNS